MAYVTIVLDETVTAAARERIERRVTRLAATDPDLSGATIEYRRGDSLGGDATAVECADEILGAQLYGVVADEIRAAEAAGQRREEQ